ncbi:kinase-like domain-containing protein [Staphylotrichum tortipilum]|uniref:Kinase-like domain-containing protein n=1 Tax=Staphylotrichum tortipilum TaxID=2831512 RepID=A0AAN6MEI0_9PEZI|nr:kinase-like domain-containing protein [Staphylotrichum longicolle]
MDAQHAVPADWIARLYPADRVGGAQRVIERHPCCVRPERSRPQSRSSREPTVEAPENDAQENYLPYIDIKFSDAPQHQGGLIFGSAATSDIVLPREAGVSARHLTLTFKDPSKNGRYCLTLRDLGSCQGTTVTYDGQARARRKRFDWIVAGPSFCAEVKTVHIMFHKALWFRLIVNHHAASSPGYREKVERFCRGAAGYGELMGSLDLQSEPTTHPITGVHTPPDDAIVIEQHWNIGNTSQVGPRFWNVSTGEECAALHPSTTAYDKAQWKNLVDTWKRISHQNIVRLVGWVLEPLPRAYLELLPLRTLRQEHETRSFSARDMSLVLRQSLSALVDIHGQQVPLAHGGIGPDSILVQHRGPREGDLHIKLYPAGLSAQASPPPELIGAARPGIPAPAMDIWSLGIAILWLKWGFLPESNIQGCHLAVTRVQTPGADNIDKVLRKMLVIKPEGRSSAAECLGLASRLFGQNQPMSVPIPGLASSSGGQNQRAATRSHQVCSTPMCLGSIYACR